MTDTTGKTPDTSERVPLVQYKPYGESSDIAVNNDTHSYIVDNTPGVYKRRITSTSAKTPARISVVYNHQRVQRELSFIRANKILEEQRNSL